MFVGCHHKTSLSSATSIQFVNRLRQSKSSGGMSPKGLGFQCVNQFMPQAQKAPKRPALTMPMGHDGCPQHGQLTFPDSAKRLVMPAQYPLKRNSHVRRDTGRGEGVSPGNGSSFMAESLRFQAVRHSGQAARSAEPLTFICPARRDGKPGRRHGRVYPRRGTSGLPRGTGGRRAWPPRCGVPADGTRGRRRTP